jgi:hypothetical protein
VTVYTKQDLHITYIDDIHIPEAATITIQIHKDKRTNNPIHTIISLYRRPRPHPHFITNLQNSINKIHTKYPKTSITIIGDINIDLLNPPADMKDFMIDNNLHTTITTPTRYDPHHHTATLIDVIITTLTDTATTAGTLSPPITDHLPIYTIFHNTVPRQKARKQKQLSTKRYIRQKDTILPQIQAALTELPQDENTTTAQQFYNIQTTIQRVIEENEKTPKLRKQPWCTPKFKKQLRKQHKLHEMRVRNPTPENAKKHKQYRNKLRKSITNAKTQAIQQKLQDASGDPKQQAKILKTLIPSRSSARNSPTVITYENKTYTDPTEIANALNDHYITIGDKTSKTIPQSEQKEEQIENSETDHPPFTLKHIKLDQTTKTMKAININKASDIYKIKPAIIKDLTPYLAPKLTKLFNQAIDENAYPDPLKVTKLIELYKAKDKTDPRNYRPISLLPIIAKVFDTLINNQIMQHLTKHNIISPTQFAFRPNSNTTLALQAVINHIHAQKNKHQPILGIYIDLSKAYDTISHEKLIHKLQHEFNFTHNTTTFFRSYFQNRQQSTHTQHAHSKTQTITHGIPQGSTLSTTFFLLYINNIIQTVPESKVYTYADDTTLIITADSIKDLQRLAQTELNSLINYFHTNNLVPNPTKTNFSVFYPKATDQTACPVIKIGDTILEQNAKAKLLGIMVQDDLKNKHTITLIRKKLQPTIQRFKYATKLLPTHWMKQLYYIHVYPHLTGCISVWGTDDHKATYMQPLIRTHKKIIRIIKNLPPRTHTKPLMTELKILNITNLYTHRVCLEMHPFIHETEQVNRPEHNHHYTPTNQVHNHLTRHSTNEHFFINNQQGPAMTPHLTRKYITAWNKLPVDLRTNSSRSDFKFKLKHFLLEKQSQCI